MFRLIYLSSSFLFLPSKGIKLNQRCLTLCRLCYFQAWPSLLYLVDLLFYLFVSVVVNILPNLTIPSVFSRFVMLSIYINMESYVYWYVWQSLLFLPDLSCYLHIIFYINVMAEGNKRKTLSLQVYHNIHLKTCPLCTSTPDSYYFFLFPMLMYLSKGAIGTLLFVQGCYIVHLDICPLFTSTPTFFLSLYYFLCLCICRREK